MSRPWSIRRREHDRAPARAGGIGGLTDALRSRTNALQAASKNAARGIRSDYRDFASAGAIPEVAGADELVDALASRIDKISAECGEVAALLERYAAFALAAEIEAAPQADGPEVVHAGEGLEADPAGLDLTDGPAPTVAPPASVEGEAQVEPEAQVFEPGPQQPVPPARAVEISAGIRLLATQMSVAGSDRGEIERRLREDFGVANANEVVAGIFGA